MSDCLIIVSQPVAGISFGLKFTRDGDRFSHQIFARPVAPGSDIFLYSSFEGGNDEDWPPSPPLQDMHQQKIGDQQVVMAVGMAGHSHWSAACTLQESGNQVGFHFDMACRVDDTPGWLGSSYQDLLSLNEGDEESILDPFDISLVPLDVDGATSQITTQDGRIQIAAGAIGSIDQHAKSLKNPSRTIRWQYLFELTRRML